MEPVSIELLKLFDSRSRLSLLEISVIHNCSAEALVAPFAELKSKEYIHNVEWTLDSSNNTGLIHPEHHYAITQGGKSYLYELKKARKERFRGDVRYWVTTLIAVAALVNSILARLGL